jgi:hypothetical protein
MSQESVDPSVGDVEEPVDTTGLAQVSSEALPPEGPMENPTEAVELATISRRDVLIRAQSWINEHVMYSQTQYHANKYGRYRQDCSGYVSMCWQLPFSYTTATIMTVAHRITWPQLLPGDALWRHAGHEGHIALFVGWADGAHTKPVVDEEYNTGHPCERRVWNHGYAATFHPIRYNHIA